MKKSLKDTLKSGKFENVSKRRSKTMAAIRSTDNKTTEKRLRFSLVKNKIKGWKLQPNNIDGKPDFYFPNQKMAIFVDGCFWHGCPICGHIPKTNTSFWETKIKQNINRDNKVNLLLEYRGIKVIRFWEHDLSKDLKHCIKIIRMAISNCSLSSR